VLVRIGKVGALPNCRRGAPPLVLPARSNVRHEAAHARAIAELREVGSDARETEVHAAPTSADQCVATAEARLAEEIQRRRDAEAERERRPRVGRRPRRYGHPARHAEGCSVFDIGMPEGLALAA
jgi:hypothetical protein